MESRMSPRLRFVLSILALTTAIGASVYAQDRLKSMPGYDQFVKMSREIPESVTLGTLTVRWKDDGSSFEYTWDGKRYVYDVATKRATQTGVAAAPVGGGGRSGRGGGVGLERGRQYDSAESPDKKLKAFYKDRNLWLSGAD